MIFDRSGKKVRPGTFGKYKSRLTGVSKKVPVKEHEIRSDPISADPICPLPSLAGLAATLLIKFRLL